MLLQQMAIKEANMAQETCGLPRMETESRTKGKSRWREGSKRENGWRWESGDGEEEDNSGGRLDQKRRCSFTREVLWDLLFRPKWLLT